MTKQKKRGSHKHTGGSESRASERKLHKDWRVWLVVAMMLTAMIAYVLTLDDSVVPLLLRR